MKTKELFHRFAVLVSSFVGSPFAFVAAVLIILVWLSTGPLFHFSNTWQLIINTGTTIVTLLMVFLIQNTQNRDARATHIKLDELLKSIRGARTSLVNIEEVSDEELTKLQQEFRDLHEHYSKELIKRGKNIKVTPKEELEASK